MANPATGHLRTRRPTRDGSHPPRRSLRPGLERFLGMLATRAPELHDHVLLLGMTPAEPRQLVAAVERGLPYSAFEQLVASTSLPATAILAVINIPSRTLTRRKREGRFQRDESDRLVRAARIVAHALTLFEGDRDAAVRWLTQPQRALGGEAPLRLARTELGAIEVDRLIGRLEHGVFT